MRLLIALLLLAHGIAHFVGVRNALWPESIQPRRLIYLPRAVEALSWLLLGLGFVGVSALFLTSHDGWRALLLGASAGSLLMCVAAWPQARLGLIVDTVLVLLVLLLAPTSTESYVVVAEQGVPSNGR